MTNVAVAAAARDKRCGLSPQKRPGKSGPAVYMAVASRKHKTVERMSVGPRSHMERAPRPEGPEEGASEEVGNELGELLGLVETEGLIEGRAEGPKEGAS